VIEMKLVKELQHLKKPFVLVHDYLRKTHGGGGRWKKPVIVRR
jgi:hypothetical protein